MHEPLTGRIEEYLQGSVSMPEVDNHLKHCDSCRHEVAEMKQHAALLRSLRADADPSAGFYARVLNRIDQQSQSVWSVFSDSLFAKRLAYASMTFVVLLGTYLVSTTQQDQQPYASSAPEVIIANDDHIHPAVGDNPQQNRETVLVNLASYQQ